MKKLIKNISKALCLLFVFSFSIISIVGCGNKDISEDKKASNTASSTIGGDINNSADNVNQDDTIDKEVVLNGIYKYARPVIYADTYWTISNDEIFDYFDTTDINGVYNALLKLNFLDIVNSNIYELDGDTIETMVYFNQDKFIPIEFDGLYYLAGDEYNINEITSKIEIIDADNFIVHAPFWYVNDAGDTVETPIIVKVPFVKIADSENTLVGKIYTYQTGSANIELTNQSTMTKDEAFLKLAELFEINADADISAEVEDMFANFDIQIDELLSKVTFLCKYDDTFMFATVQDATSTIDGITVSLTGRSINVATGVETLNLQIVIDENTTFTFAYQAA